MIICLLTFRKEDLVVSAPFYHAHLVGGAIYIYYHGANVSWHATRLYFMA